MRQVNYDHVYLWEGDNMKTLMDQKSKRLKSFFLATVLVSGATISAAQANNDALLTDTDSILNSEQINIDGQFRKKSTTAKQLAKLRKKMEKAHVEMIQKRIEDIRLQEELKIGQRLKMAFGTSSQDADSVTMGQAAVAKQNISGMLPSLEKQKKHRVIPSVGLLNVKSDNTNFDSINANLAFETTIKERFLVGLSVGYANLDIKDVNPNYANSFNSFNNFNNFGFNNFATNGLTTGREMSYKQLDIAVNGKFYVLKNIKD